MVRARWKHRPAGVRGGGGLRCRACRFDPYSHSPIIPPDSMPRSSRRPPPRTPVAGGRGRMFWSTLSGRRERCRAAGEAEDRVMPERRWRVTTGGGPGLFLIEVDDGHGFRRATTAEVDAALRQRELFGAADYPEVRVPTRFVRKYTVRARLEPSGAHEAGPRAVKTPREPFRTARELPPRGLGPGQRPSGVRSEIRWRRPRRTPSDRPSRERFPDDQAVGRAGGRSSAPR